MAKGRRVGRREFLSAAGSAAVAATVPSLTKADWESGWSEGAQGSFSGEAAAGWSSNPVTRKTVEHTSGIPLGGIGAGSVEVRADGHFHDWLMFNSGSWAPNQPQGEQGGQPDMGPGALSLFLRVRQVGGEPQLRRLGIRSDQNDLYSLGWVKNVQGITFEGRMPMARLAYHDESLPIEATAEFFSPFVPHDERTSGTPGFHGVLSLKNLSQRPVEVSLLALLRNPVAWGLDRRELANEVKAQRDGAILTYRTRATGPRHSTLGSMSLAVQGGEPSWIAGDFDAYLGNGDWSWGSFGTVHESFLRGFREQGRLPSLLATRAPEVLTETPDAIRSMSRQDKRDALGRLLTQPSFASFAERVRAVDPAFLESDAGLTEFLLACRDRLDSWAGKDRKAAAWGSGALCSRVQLKPGERREFRLALAWHFPNHFSGQGPRMGHMYENWFADSQEAATFLLKEHAAHRALVHQFVETLTGDNLPEELPCAWSGQLSTLIKCSWWIKNGRFAIWEGLGCCGFHTTDITYQGSFGLLALFPELQKRQMLMGAGYQRSDGRVHHFFTPDLMHVDNGFDRVDMNPQTVMMVCRDFLWTGDKEYLKAMWPTVVRAMASTALLDSDGDGLPDQGTRRNTYDQWDFSGSPSYICSLWLGALDAATVLARALGEQGLAEQWADTARRALASFDDKLWNGEYYDLWVSAKDKDQSCMTDQLSGIWFAQLSGFQSADQRPRHTGESMAAVYRHNYSPELGLWNASYPAGTAPKFKTYMNAQATACWTGIEYAFASMLIANGRYCEGLSIVRTVHDRYSRAGRNWNHVECGDHYYRAMSSWALLLAVSGLRYDATARHLTLSPAPPGNVKVPWFLPQAYGSCDRSVQRTALTCKQGRLMVERLTMASSSARAKVALNGKPLQVRVSGTSTVFAGAVELKPGDRLTVG